MKIRQGFVSNSSTSSFCIYGTILDSDEIIENLKTEYKAMFALSDDEDELEPYEIFEKFFDDEKFLYHEIDGSYYLGREWSSIKDDETGLQFKDSVKSIIEKYFDIEDLRFNTHEEAYAD